MKKLAFHEKMSFMDHLMELRSRILWVIGTVVVCMLVSIPLLSTAMDYIILITREAYASINIDYNIKTFKPMEGFSLLVKIALILSILMASPFILYHIWSFLSPGLKSQEKKILIPFMFSCPLLFCLGIVFAFSYVLPAALRFFLHIDTLYELEPTYGAAFVMDMCLTMGVVFGIAFEMPVVIIILCISRIVTPKELGAIRKYIIFGSVLLGAILTPPDIFSQIILALTLYALFEVGLLIAKFLLPKSTE